MTQPTVFTIPPGESFVDALAGGLMDETAGDPLTLSSMLILLPTRRACRALREAFLRHSGGRPLLLPRMRPLGDADEEELSLGDDGDLSLPPAVPPLTRQLLLARLILGVGAGRGGYRPTPEQAAQLAAELARLLDQVHTEGLDFSRLASLVPEDFATHWQLTLDFLAILSQHWPEILAEQGWMEATLRRNRLLETQAERWLAEPPPFPVLAAGSTGSIPATARLLTVVANLPRGRLVLPGLDQTMDAASRSVLDQTHPQYGLYQLLDRLELAPDEVALWPGTKAGRRDRLIAETMRPAATTEAWRRLGGTLMDDALAGVTRLTCPGPREEAAAIALMMREVLESDGRTAALVTPDRDLARRTAAELRRYGIEIDDSAGQPLSLTAVGAFLSLTARMVVEDFPPHAVLAALKHPLACGGLPAGTFRSRVRRLEREVLRGPRPGSGATGLIAALAPDSDLGAWLTRLADASAAFAKLAGRPDATLEDLLKAHVSFAEWLAADEKTTGAGRLWRGEAGEAAAAFVADLAEAAGALPPVGGRGYPGLLAVLMPSVMVRPAWGGHPRLAIWGPLEARLQHADRLILGGLNEGCWPPETTADPWMSRPMRKSFGLPLPERRIGLSAHDFAQAFAAPEVILTRSARIDGAPTVPSRWLLRLDAVLRAAGVTTSWPAGDWLAWQEARDRPDQFAKPVPPAPRPPLAARPRSLSATAIETWMRDPYAIYARRILGLEALDPIDADPGAADYGSLVHGALDAFLKAHPSGPLPAGALDQLLALGRDHFAAVAARPGLWAFWWPRFERIAGWFVAQETARRDMVTESWSEISGALEIAAPGGPFRVTAKADRVDRLTDGSLAIVDYKTGAPPSVKEVAAGFAPQLPIEAAIADHGGFPSLPGGTVSQLLYWRLSGGQPGGEERAAGKDVAALAQQALDGLAELIARFDDETTPYAARPHPEMAPKYSDYLHLARVKEWASGEDGDE
ncbi:double-strand break repair protein AddB [Telmatospirillum sp.]|uniref:double-strand break repair protein AddB n=1 Tax=Telmatospirillum sp. TaxID=2079197 RepID=UPI0028489BAD|nr:double-strand break repair protein AddB [Telmatospirillum sp.]MDR3440363.1 double-strand break repair protein AddB [Telmatospirillum sp.]